MWDVFLHIIKFTSNPTVNNRYFKCSVDQFYFYLKENRNWNKLKENKWNFFNRHVFNSRHLFFFSLVDVFNRRSSSDIFLISWFSLNDETYNLRPNRPKTGDGYFRMSQLLQHWKTLVLKKKRVSCPEIIQLLGLDITFVKGNYIKRANRLEFKQVQKVEHYFNGENEPRKTAVAYYLSFRLLIQIPQSRLAASFKIRHIHVGNKLKLFVCWYSNVIQ